MYCIHCGEKLTKGSAFCNHCGGKVGDTKDSSQPSIKTTGMFSPVAAGSGNITMDVNDVKIDNSKTIDKSKTDINAEVIAHVERDMIIDKRNIDKRKTEIKAGPFAKVAGRDIKVDKRRTNIKIGGILVIGVILLLTTFIIRPSGILDFFGFGGGGLPLPDGRFVSQEIIPFAGYDWLEFNGSQLTFPLTGVGNITVRYTYNDGILSFSMREAGAQMTMEWLVRIIDNNTLGVDMAHNMFPLSDMFPELKISTEIIFVRER